MTSRHHHHSVKADVHILHPGDVVCAERNVRLETLLGSCVAVVLADPRRTIGAMCHIVHARPAAGATSKPEAHADAAIDSMYAKLRQFGFSPQLCEAYVYGGGNMFPGRFSASHVGSSNSQHVLERLQHDGIRVLLHDVGGNAYRRLTWTVGRDAPAVTAIAIEESSP